MSSSATLPPPIAVPHPQRRETPVETRPAFLQQRLHSLDTYRGLIMVSLAFVGFGLASTSQNHLGFPERATAISALGLLATPNGQAALMASSAPVAAAQMPKSTFWQNVHFHFEHAEWVGGGYWDMIQPSFMFMVGAAMAYSYLKRREMGQLYGRMLLHAFTRSLILIFLGIFLISNGQRTTTWSPMNVLTQIGLAYTFLFMLWGRSFRTQAIAAAVILIGVWLLYVLYPHAGINLETGQRLVADASLRNVGISKEWAQKHLTGVSPAWHKSANVGHAIDLWLLNKLPDTRLPEVAAKKRAEGAIGPYEYNSGGYQTINFISSLVTMLFGLMCGELLRSERSSGQKFFILVGAGVAGILVGLLLDVTGVCPLVKHIWTLSWTLYSTGWCCLILASLYGVIDVLGFRSWTFPLIVVGVNSIAIYSMSMMLKPWASRTLQTHFGPDVFLWAGPLFVPTVQAVMVGMMFWLVCLWMYRQKIFIRI